MMATPVVKTLNGKLPLLLLTLIALSWAASPALAVEAVSEHFRVTDRIEYGNLANPRLTEGTDTLEVGFMAHPHGGIETLWFCFRLERLKAGPFKKVRIVLENLDTVLGGGRPDRICPVIKAPGGEWERLPPGQVRLLEDGRRHAVWDLPAPASSVDVAACYPYGMPEVRELVEDCGGFYRMDEIGISQEGRPIVRLSNHPGEEDGNRPGVYLIARQHSGETPGSWVLDGILRRFAEEGDGAPLIWCAPLANIDGVEEGDYGKDPFPHDLNRAWGRPPMRHEVLVLQKDARLWKKRCDPRIFLDVHAPGYSENAGFYAFGHPEESLEPAQVELQKRYCDAFEAALRHRITEPFLRIASYPRRWDPKDGSPISAGSWFLREIGGMALSVECTYAFGGEKLYTPSDYREVGAEMAQVILDLNR